MMFKVGDQVRIKKDFLEQAGSMYYYWRQHDRLIHLKKYWDGIFTITSIDVLCLYILDLKIDLLSDGLPRPFVFIDKELELVDSSPAAKPCDCPLDLILIKGCQIKDHF